MRRRLFPPRLVLLFLVLVVALPATGQPPVDRPEDRGEVISLGAPARMTETGPLFALRPIVSRLGGSLTGAGTITLTLGDTRIVAGDGNATVLVDQEIVQLSQPPQLSGGEEGGGTLLVPLDFLRATYGQLDELRLRLVPGGAVAHRPAAGAPEPGGDDRRGAPPGGEHRGAPVPGELRVRDRRASAAGSTCAPGATARPAGRRRPG